MYDSFSVFFGIIGILSVIFDLVATIIIRTESDYRDNSLYIKYPDLYKMAKKAVIFGLLSLFFICFIPSKNQIIKAYLMYHGSQIVTAEKTEKGINELTKRVDKFIKILDKNND